jgi:hypothetical protein
MSPVERVTIQDAVSSEKAMSCDASRTQEVAMSVIHE